MNEKKSINPPINPGISLLIVVFLVLCLFTFSAITLTTAINEYKRSNILAENTKSYYDAANKAEEEINSLITYLKENNSWSISGTKYLTYTIDDTQELAITLEPLPAPVEGKYFNITKWQVVSTQTWETNDTMNLLIP